MYAYTPTRPDGRRRRSPDGHSTRNSLFRTAPARAHTHAANTAPRHGSREPSHRAPRPPAPVPPGAHAAAFALRHYGTRSGALKTAGHMHAHARCARARLAISEPF